MLRWLICKDAVLGTIFQLMMVTGVAAVNGLGIGNAVNWGSITILCTIPAILTILVMFFMPETPYYLVSKNRENDAFRSLIWLRGSTADVNSELESLKKSYKEQKECPEFSYSKLFTERVYLKPFIVVLALMFTQQFSGVNAVFFNLKHIFLKAGSQIDAGLSAFIISLVQVRN
jgi:facilitated trehalose transporter